MDKSKINRTISVVAFILALIPTAIAALLVFSHTQYSPWGAFLDPALEFVMEYGWSWTYWLAIAFAVLAAAGVIATFFMQQGFPVKKVWILNIFTVLFLLADILLFFMVFEAGSAIGFINAVASL